MLTPSFSLTATERVLPRMALDFTTALLDSRVTVTRALDTATAVNSSGFVAGVNANLPRFDYEPVTKTCKGLLIEELRANVCIQSGDIDNVAWSRAGVGVVGDTVTSPAGTMTGNTVTCSAGSSVHRVVSTAGAVTSGASVTHSVFVKAGTHNFFQIHDGSTATFYANFNLSTGIVTAVNPANGATITPFGDSWYRCTFTLTAGTTTSIGAICVIPDGTSVRNPTWTALGTESIYAWGYQIEVGAFATSYIPTTTTSLTRNADVVSMTGTNFSSWYNTSGGVFAAQFIPMVRGGSRNIIYTPNLAMYMHGSNGIAIYDGVNVAISSTALTVGSVQKACTSFGALNLRQSLNGNAVSASAAYNNVFASANQCTLSYLNSMWFQKLAFYPQELTAAEMQSFSK